MPEPRQHTQRRNWIETIGRMLPGFRGYLEKEYRRESDRLQRKWLVDRVKRGRRGLDELARRLVDASQIDTLPLVERVRTRLDHLQTRIEGAAQGYSGFYDLVRIDNRVLDRVYAFDVGLMEQISILADMLDALPARDASPKSELEDSLRYIATIEAAWDRREDLITGLD